MTDTLQQIAGNKLSTDIAQQTATQLFSNETKQEDNKNNNNNTVSELKLEVIPSLSMDGITREQTLLPEQDKLKNAIFSPKLDKQIAVDDFTLLLDILGHEFKQKNRFI